GAVAPADERGMRARAAARGVSCGLDDENRRAFTEGETGAPAIERPARLERERVQRVEPRERHAAERLRAAGHDGVDASQAAPIDRRPEPVSAGPPPGVR